MVVVKRLGKGLGALIPDMDLEDQAQPRRLLDVEVSTVKPNPFQPRDNFDSHALGELKQSIAENGVIQPISVRVVNSGYELIAGERRLRAVRDLGLDRIPAFIIAVNTDEEMLELSLVENIQREDLNPIDEANGYKTLISKCNLTQDEVAKKVGRDRTTITNCLRLLNLPSMVQDSLVRGEISAGHARAILALPEKNQQIDWWKKTIKNKYSVRQVEKLVKRSTQPSKPKKEKRKEINPFIREAEDKLRSILGTQVRIHEKSKGGQGRIEVEYYSDTDLERILDLMARI